MKSTNEGTKTIPNLGIIVAGLEDKNLKKALIDIVEKTEKKSKLAIDYLSKIFIKETRNGYEEIRDIVKKDFESRYSEEVEELYNAVDKCIEWIKDFEKEIL